MDAPNLLFAFDLRAPSRATRLPPQSIQQQKAGRKVSHKRLIVDLSALSFNEKKRTTNFRVPFDQMPLQIFRKMISRFFKMFRLKC